MRSRVEILRDLVRFAAPLDGLRKELAHYQWNSPNVLLLINPEDVTRVLSRFLKGDLTSESVEEWANALELREDLGFGSELVKEAVFDLANPVLQGHLTLDSASRWLHRLSQTR